MFLAVLYAVSASVMIGLWLTDGISHPTVGVTGEVLVGMAFAVLPILLSTPPLAEKPKGPWPYVWSALIFVACYTLILWLRLG